MGMMHTLSVGQLYHPGRTQWPEVGEYNYRAWQHELRLFWRAPSDADIEAVRAGAIHLGLYVRQPVVWLLYRIEGACDWSDAPYSIHLVAGAERTPPDPVTAETRALLTVVLADADTGIVRALRAVSMSPRFTRALHAAIAQQLAQPFDAAQHEAQIAATYARYSHSKQMARDATITEKAGAI